MAVIRIARADDPRIAVYRGLSDRELLRPRGLFVAEGRLVVERIIADGFAIHSLLITTTISDALQSSLATLNPSTPIYVCEREWFREITGFNIHRGCLALAARPAPVDRAAILRSARTIVVLEAVADADNVGGVFRNAVAFGADAIFLSPTCCDPLYRKAIRTSMAATLRLPFVRLEQWPDGLNDLRRGGFAVVALTPRQPAQTLEQFVAHRHPNRLALLVGNEGGGLTDDVMRLADHRVRIPIANAVDSLNLAVAAGIALSRLSTAAGL